MKIKVDFFKDDLVEAIGEGVYEIWIEKDGKSKPLYIGESVFVLVRCATHLYQLRKNPNYFGFIKEQIDDDAITLKFSLNKEKREKESRKAQEKRIIRERNPISQSGISDHQKSIEEKIEALKQFLNDN